MHRRPTMLFTESTGEVVAVTQSADEKPEQDDATDRFVWKPGDVEFEEPTGDTDGEAR